MESQGVPAPSARAADEGAGAPLVSAIVSTYASERFMEGRLRDLLAQTLGARLEVVVVDSASPQGEGAIVRRFTADHPNVRYLRTPEREGLYAAWNRGIRAARGRYLTSANADDRLRPDALERLARELDAHPEAGLVYADVFTTGLENQEFLHHVRTGCSIRPDYRPEIMLDGCHMGPQPLWRRSLHDEAGWFDESFAVAGDYEFWCRVARRRPLRHLPEFLGLYFHNPAGICNADRQRAAREAAEVKRRYARDFPPPPAGLPRGRFYRGVCEPGRYVNVCLAPRGALERTRTALDALVRHTAFPHVLTVVDRASGDGTREHLAALRLQGAIGNLVLLDEDAGAERACEIGRRAEPAARWFLRVDGGFAPRDPRWLEELVRAAGAATDLGTVSPDGPIGAAAGRPRG